MEGKVKGHAWWAHVGVLIAIRRSKLVNLVTVVTTKTDFCLCPILTLMFHNVAVHAYYL